MAVQNSAAKSVAGSDPVSRQLLGLVPWLSKVGKGKSTKTRPGMTAEDYHNEVLLKQYEASIGVAAAKDAATHASRLKRSEERQTHKLGQTALDNELERDEAKANNTFLRGETSADNAFTRSESAANNELYRQATRQNFTPATTSTTGSSDTMGGVVK